MPLSEHEQRMLDEIESALYAEDPKFASAVRGRHVWAPSARRRLQALVILLVGLGLLIAGVAVPALRLGGFPIVSLIGFVVMFAGGVMVMLGTPWGRNGPAGAAPSGEGKPTTGANKPKAAKTGRGAKQKRHGSFTERMEERFRKRFD
ncbi:DUF3040 domain-containing protein [Tomitella biformata]|uniref:DUF3040 domain-containing protein n=1 Tax=Tomitella biformata TaxID=630403 RepID=UPI000463DA5A|nr:DUF3040 domain-containing protein [Tomitella biformata]